MDDSLKRRLVGAIVLVSLVVIFVPMLLEDEPVVGPGITITNIPPPPSAEAEFASRIQPLEGESPPPVAVAGPGGSAPPAPPPATSAPAASAAPVQPRVGLSAWVVQVGSFSARDKAEQLVEQLKQKKLPAFVEPITVDKKTLFRVRVGPEVDAKRAEAMRAEVEKLLSLKTRLEQYP